MRQIYVGDRDHRIDFTTLSMGNNNIVLKNLLIEREYQWCSYF